MDFEKLAAPLVQVYEEITDQILENIARHFNTGKSLPTIDWQMRKLAEMGQLRQENLRIIARKTGQNPELIRIALENAASQALKKAEPELKEAVRRGYLHDGGPLETSSSVSRVFASYQRQAMAKIVEVINPVTGQPTQVDQLDHTAQQIDDAVALAPQLSNPNPLINWYFPNPVNQKGQVEYTSAGYTIDMWEARTNYMSVALTDDGLVLKDTAGGVPDIIFDHKNELQDGIALAGKQVTFSSLVKSVTGTIVMQGGGYSVQIRNAGLCQFTVNSFVGNSEYLIRFFNQSDGAEITITAVKVELGPRQTLAHQDADGNCVLNDPPPNKALELLKCQRYYQIFATNALRPTDKDDFRPPMRITPALGTITIDGKTYYTADANL